MPHSNKANNTQIEYLELEGDFDELKNSSVFLELLFESYLRGAHTFIDGLIFVFDSNNIYTLSQLKPWTAWLHSATQSLVAANRHRQDLQNPHKLSQIQQILDNLPVILIANKCDKFFYKPKTKISNLDQASNHSRQFELLASSFSKTVKHIFDFPDHGNLLFLSTESSKEELEVVNLFVEQVFLAKEGHAHPDSGKFASFWDSLRVRGILF